MVKTTTYAYTFNTNTLCVCVGWGGVLFIYFLVYFIFTSAHLLARSGLHALHVYRFNCRISSHGANRSPAVFFYQTMLSV